MTRAPALSDPPDSIVVTETENEMTTRWFATYTDPMSRSGIGYTIVSTEDMPRIVASYPDVEFRLYTPADTEGIFTPAVVAACNGKSASL